MIVIKWFIFLVQYIVSMLVVAIIVFLLSSVILWVVRRIRHGNDEWYDFNNMPKPRPPPPYVPEDSLPAPTNIPSWVAKPKDYSLTPGEQILRQWQLEDAKRDYIEQFDDVPTRWSAGRRFRQEIIRLEELGRQEALRQEALLKERAAKLKAEKEAAKYIFEDQKPEEDKRQKPKKDDETYS